MSVCYLKAPLPSIIYFYDESAYAVTLSCRTAVLKCPSMNYKSHPMISAHAVVLSQKHIRCPVRWWLSGGDCRVVTVGWWLSGGDCRMVTVGWWLSGGDCRTVTISWTVSRIVRGGGSLEGPPGRDRYLDTAGFWSCTRLCVSICTSSTNTCYWHTVNNVSVQTSRDIEPGLSTRTEFKPWGWGWGW